jgi:hypothetical protein
LVVQEPHKPEQHRVIVSIVDKKTNTVQPVADQVIYKPAPLAPTPEEIVKPVVITKNLYDTVITQDTELQTTIKTVETKHT